MPHGMEFEGISFTPDTLQQFPAHSTLIGQIITGFSLVEGGVGGIYGLLRHSDIEQAIEDLKKLGSNSKRVEAVRKAITSNAVLSADTSNDELMKKVLSYAEKRNKIAHGVWGGHPSKPDILFCLPTKKWINYLGTVVYSGTHGTFLEEADKLKTQLEQYEIAKLEVLKEEGSQILISVFALFNQLGRTAANEDGWQQN